MILIRYFVAIFGFLFHGGQSISKIYLKRKMCRNHLKCISKTYMKCIKETYRMSECLQRSDKDSYSVLRSDARRQSINVNQLDDCLRGGVRVSDELLAVWLNLKALKSGCASEKHPHLRT